MTISCSGPFITASFDANEFTTNIAKVELPTGYSYEQIYIFSVNNITEILPGMPVKVGENLIFPTVNSKSPSFLPLRIHDITQPASIRLSITKFGQIPDVHYFDKAFIPITVTGDDGKEYNVIPSDQFK